MFTPKGKFSVISSPAGVFVGYVFVETQEPVRNLRKLEGRGAFSTQLRLKLVKHA